MQAAPARFLGAVLWPLTIWPSLLRFEEHGADDYVERTFPIVATAIGFWACVGLLISMLVQGGVANVSLGDGGSDIAARYVPRWAGGVSGVLWFFLPALYIIGLWLFAKREDLYQR